MTVFDPAAFSIQPNARRLEKPWGYEVLLSPADAPYTAKLIHVRAGKRLSLQLHDTKVETQTLVAGLGDRFGGIARLHDAVARAADANRSVHHGSHRRLIVDDQDQPTRLGVVSCA